MSNVIFLSGVRLSFPHLVEPQERKNQETGKITFSYNAEFIMPRDHAGYAQFMARYAALALEFGKEHAQAIMGMIQSDRKSRCFGAGEEKIKAATFLPYEGYAGLVYITAGKDTPPQIIQDDGTAIDPKNTMAYQQLSRKMYGGCYVNAAVKPWWQKPNKDKQYGHGIRCDLVAVQFAADGPAFGDGGGAAIDTSGMFGAVVGSAPSFMQPAAPAMPAAPFGMPSFLGGQ